MGRGRYQEELPDTPGREWLESDVVVEAKEGDCSQSGQGGDGWRIPPLPALHTHTPQPLGFPVSRGSMVSSWDFSQSLCIGTPCFRAYLLQQVPHSCQSGLSAIEGPSLFSLLKAGTPKSSSQQASDTPRGLACLPVRPASPCPLSPELFIPLPQTFACLYFFFFFSWPPKS